MKCLKLLLIIYLSNTIYLSAQIFDDLNFQINSEISKTASSELNTRLGFNNNILRYYMLIELDDFIPQINNILVNPRNPENTPFFIPVCYEGVTNAQYNYIMTEVNDLDVSALNLVFTPAQGGVLNTFDNPDATGMIGNTFILYDHGMFLYDRLRPNFFYWSVRFQDNRIRRLYKRLHDISSFGLNEPALEERPMVSTKGIKKQRTQVKINESFTVLRFDTNRNTYTASRIKSFSDGSEEKTDIWTARDGHLPLVRRLEEEHERYSGLDVSHFISSEDKTNDQKLGSILISENNEHFLVIDKINHRMSVYSENDFENISDAELESVSPSNNLNIIGTTTIDTPYIYTNEHGQVFIKDASSPEVALPVEANCISPEPFSNHVFLLDNTGAILLQSSSGHLVWSKLKNQEVKCHFPSIGKSILTKDQKLIDYNATPTPSNKEVNYLLSLDGSKITIKIRNMIKIIDKSQFNGNFETSPAVQMYSFIP